MKGARRKPGSNWPLDEMFVTLRGQPYLLWRAVDEALGCRLVAPLLQQDVQFRAVLEFTEVTQNLPTAF